MQGKKKGKIKKGRLKAKKVRPNSSGPRPILGRNMIF